MLQRPFPVRFIGSIVLIGVFASGVLFLTGCDQKPAPAPPTPAAVTNAAAPTGGTTAPKPGYAERVRAEAAKERESGP